MWHEIFQQQKTQKKIIKKLTWSNNKNLKSEKNSRENEGTLHSFNNSQFGHDQFGLVTLLAIFSSKLI